MAQAVKDPKTRGAGGGGIDVVLPGYGDYGGGKGGGPHRLANARIAVWIALVSITLLFGSFVAAYAARDTAGDWVPIQAPPLLFLNAAILAVSSFAIERARRRFDSWRPLAFRRWMLVTAALGTTFLLGQVVLWTRLAEQRVGLSGHPHGSFFYLLSGAHAAHVVVGLLVLHYVLAARYRLLPGESQAPGLAATYWHFVGGMWLCLLAALFFL